MHYRITVEGSKAQFACGSGESVLSAMLRSGRGPTIKVGCRSGGCGVCRVAVIEGDYATGDMSQAEISPQCRADGIALACQVFPRSDLCVRAIGKRVAQVSNDDFLRQFGISRTA